MNAINISIMKIREITESVDCEPGWQESQNHRLPGNLGVVEIGHRLDEKCQIVETMMNYYNKRISNKSDGFVYGIRLNDRGIMEFDKNFPEGNNIQIPGNKIKERFDNVVGQHLTAAARGLLENVMNNEEIRRKLEVGGLYALCPELGNAIDLAVSRHYQAMKERNAPIAEDFEPGIPGGNALDAIPTSDPKKQKPPKKELAKRKINGLAQPR